MNFAGEQCIDTDRTFKKKPTYSPAPRVTPHRRKTRCNKSCDHGQQLTPIIVLLEAG